MLQRPILSRDASRRLVASAADVFVFLGTLAILYFVARTGSGAFTSFRPPQVTPQVNLDPSNLPYYASRSVLRMFLALGCAFLFTFTYGYIAANSRRAERIMIPLLDILQSVPVLGFLSVAFPAFVSAFPGSLLGLELLSVFAIFTSQAWNMAFSFYHSLKTLPEDLNEAVTMYRLPRWQRFTRLEIPAGMIGLVWNAMMSFSGGWFFLAASEAISVLNQSYTLPGIGSYVTVAIQKQDGRALASAVLAMGVIIVLTDQLFWRPMVAWANKFKLGRTGGDAPRSWLLSVLRLSRLPRMLNEVISPVTEAYNRWVARRFPIDEPVMHEEPTAKPGDRTFNLILMGAVFGLLAYGLSFVLSEVSLGEVVGVMLAGLMTLGRVIILITASTFIWTPIGVAIGFNPRLARIGQPVVQFLSSFPANFAFPFVTAFFIQNSIDINWGGIALMMLGTQWYILFNVIAGAMSVPGELREMMTNMGLHGWRRWPWLVMPGIFGAWVTGGITAAGGAWNASIVAEVVTWGTTKLTATGLGTYVALATNAGDWQRIWLGVGIMSLYVVSFNRLVWSRLYRLSETRYRLA